MKGILYLDWGILMAQHLSKDIDENVEHDLIKIELGNFLESLDIEILEDKKMKEKYDEYVLNWDRLTYKVSEESFFK